MKTFCEHYNLGECRSCEWIKSAYQAQITQKEALLHESLSFLTEIPILPSVTSAQTGFRNKAKMAVTGSVDDPVIGITGQNDLDEGQALLDCAIHHPKLNEVIARLPDYIREFRLIPYRIAERAGELKSVILFYSETSNEMYVRFVLRSQECVSRIRKLLPKLQSEFSFITCVSANLQPIPHAILEGKDEIFVTQQNFIHHRLGKVEMKLSPRAFVQTNSITAQKLYETAATWALESHPKIFMELYAGQGAFSFFAEASAEKLIGVEINPEAVATANATAEHYKLSHVQFIAADAGQVNRLVEQHQPDVILVNPPRRGIGIDGVALIKDSKPKVVIYSSCSHESLGKDLRALSDDYEISKVQIFDLFPNTSHFETLVLILRKQTI